MANDNNIVTDGVAPDVNAQGAESTVAVSQEESQEFDPNSDLTQGSIWKHLLRISIPAMLGQMFNSIYNWIDTYWGGKISTEALAGLGIVFPVFLLSIAVGQLFVGGGMVMVSNALGAKEFKDARHYLKQTVIFSLLSGIVILGIVFLAGKPMLMLVGAEGDTLQYGWDYLKVLAFGMPLMMLFFALNVAYISRGNTKFMRNILIMGAFINLGLDPLLMLGLTIKGTTIIPAMGIQGIALATVLVQLLNVIIAWVKLQSSKETRWESYVILPDFKTIGKIMYYGLPSFLQLFMISLGLAIVNYFLAIIQGDVAVAGYGIGLRIEQLALVPTIGIGIALSALVGQNNGAKNYLRVKESFRKAIAMCAVLWIATMLPVMIFGRQISGLFAQSPETIQVSAYYLIFAFLAFMGYQIRSSASGLLQGIKKPLPPIIFASIRQLIFPWIFIPLFSYAFGWGIWGVFASVVVSIWLVAIALVFIAHSHLRKLMKASESTKEESTSS